MVTSGANLIEKQLVKCLSLLEKIKPFRNHHDLSWCFYLQLPKYSWYLMQITLYDKNYYININGRDRFEISINYPNEKTRVDWYCEDVHLAIKNFHKTLLILLKTPQKYLIDLDRRLPLRYRQGIIPRQWLVMFMKDANMPHKILGARSTEKIVRFVEETERSETHYLQDLTLSRYLEYCRQAYLANAKELKLKSKDL
jgi:hypothetical protein